MNYWQGCALCVGGLLGLVSTAARCDSVIRDPVIRESVMRDPFQPLSEMSCNSGQDQQKWQLKGMVGSSSRWIAWLVQPQIGWLRVRDGDVIPPGDWQITQLDRGGATLRQTGGKVSCGLAEIRLGPPFHHNKE
ncbi:HofP DNA utilization family protein [Dickeya ananatis]|uniref:HofP DNA utilization family protein n=2 Tax=Dickeya ananatis TaxID=3061286 RepID=UPI00388FEF77